jgi:hypothetical protein
VIKNLYQKLVCGNKTRTQCCQKFNSYNKNYHVHKWLSLFPQSEKKCCVEIQDTVLTGGYCVWFPCSPWIWHRSHQLSVHPRSWTKPCRVSTAVEPQYFCKKKTHKQPALNSLPLQQDLLDLPQSSFVIFYWITKYFTWMLSAPHLWHQSLKTAHISCRSYKIFMWNRFFFLSFFFLSFFLSFFPQNAKGNNNFRFIPQI